MITQSLLMGSRPFAVGAAGCAGLGSLIGADEVSARARSVGVHQQAVLVSGAVQAWPTGASSQVVHGRVPSGGPDGPVTIGNGVCET
jgi:hypothetical protein